MTDIKVCKFGGTSMADGNTIGRVLEIAKSDPTRRFFIVSAPGKRFGGEKKVTDLLLEAYDRFCTEGRLGEAFEKVKLRFRLIVKELHLNFPIDALLAETEEEIIRRGSRAYAASRGEYLIARIAAKALELPFFDAAELFCFEDGNFLLKSTEANIRKKLSRTEGGVIPGFYGADENGDIVTFPRGGGDISGAVVARALGACLYENWTDVSGFLVCDPHIVDNPAKIDLLTFEELKELCRMGANVLHHEAVSPVRDAGIPVAILNTFRPGERGTTIVSIKTRTACPVTGIAGGEDFIAAEGEIGMFSSLPHEAIFSEGERTLCILEKGVFERAKILTDAKETALVAVVGQGLRESIDAQARIFKAVAHAGVQVFFSGYASGVRFLLGVKKEDFRRTVRAVYEEFYRE